MTGAMLCYYFVLLWLSNFERVRAAPRALVESSVTTIVVQAKQ